MAHVDFAYSRMTTSGRKYALAKASSCASTLAVNGRLPLKPGTTCNPYIRVHCTSGTDPFKTFTIIALVDWIYSL